MRYVLVSSRKADSLGAFGVRFPVGFGGTIAYFGKRSGPGLGSWAAVFNFITLFLGNDSRKRRKK